MAIDYQDLFTRIGKCIKAANYYASVFSTMKTNGQGVVQEFADQNLDPLADGVSSAVSSHISSLSAGCAYWQNKVSEILLDPSLTNELALTAINLNNVFSALAFQMDADQEYLLESLTTVGTVSKTTNSVTAGDLIGTPILDSFSSPSPGHPVMPYLLDGYTFAKSQLGVVDTVYCKCTNSDTEGSEQFSLFGNTAVPAFQESAESIGGSISISPSDAANLFANAGMETYSGGFTGWTIDPSGATLAQETSLMYRGSSAARLNNLDDADTPSFQQTLAAPLIPGKGYFIGCRVKSVAVESGGTLGLSVSLSDGTLSANSNNTYAGAGSVVITDTNWRLLARFVAYPYLADPSVNSVVTMGFGSNVDNVDGIIFDNFFIIPATYFNGVAWGLVSGSGRFRLNDIFSSAITRSSPAVFQEFFRKTYGVQLPAVEAGSENTIDEAWAT